VSARAVCEAIVPPAPAFLRSRDWIGARIPIVPNRRTIVELLRAWRRAVTARDATLRGTERRERADVSERRARWGYDAAAREQHADDGPSEPLDRKTRRLARQSDELRGEQQTRRDRMAGRDDEAEIGRELDE
jgi:hypothetical protein